MKKYLLAILLWGCLPLLLTACGLPGITNASSTGSSSSSTSGSGTNTSNAGADTSGAVSISTNQTTYKATDQIQVSITNHLSTPIYATDMGANCSILDLNMQTDNGGWANSNVVPCTQDRDQNTIKIDPGQTYTSTIAATTSSNQKAAFPAGSYRFMLVYSNSPTIDNSDAHSNRNTIYSAAFAVTPAATPKPTIHY